MTDIQRKFIVIGGGAGVTAVTATAPLASTGGATPDISIAQGAAIPGNTLVWNGAAWVPGVPSTPLSAVLAVGNTSGVNDIYLDAGQKLDTTPALGTLNLGTTNAKLVAIGNKLAVLADDDPMILVNQGGAVIIPSNAGFQYSTKRPNRAQFRGNQFGANSAGPGATGFKSRGVNIGDMASVVAGDLLYRITAIGVPGNNSDIPLAAHLSLQVPAAGVGVNYVAAELELQLVPLEGPINGATVMFKITSQGVPVLRETDLPPVAPPVPNRRVAGLATLDGAGQFLILNPNVKAGTRFTLTVQDGGTAPTGTVYVSARVAGASFTITSNAGGTDLGVQVYWQLWEGV